MPLMEQALRAVQVRAGTENVGCPMRVVPHEPVTTPAWGAAPWRASTSGSRTARACAPVLSTLMPVVHPPHPIGPARLWIARFLPRIENLEQRMRHFLLMRDFRSGVSDA
jgi:hypothetical protein